MPTVAPTAWHKPTGKIPCAPTAPPLLNPFFLDVRLPALRTDEDALDVMDLLFFFHANSLMFPSPLPCAGTGRVTALLRLPQLSFQPPLRRPQGDGLLSALLVRYPPPDPPAVV